MFIDTHAHIYAQELNEDIENIMSRVIEQKVNKIYMPNIDKDSIDAVHQMEADYPNICFAMMGLHPCYVKEDYKSQLDIIEQQFSKRTYKAVGEIGIDLHWDLTFEKEQEEAFIRQIQLAKKYNVPIVIHSRKSLHKTIAIVKDEQDGSLDGIFHCFNGTIDQVKSIQDIGFSMGLGGVITFKNAGLDDMVKYIHRDNYVLETDAPYLAPHPNRGKPNESGYIPIIAKKVAEIRGITVEEVSKQTNLNALRIFEPTV